MFFLMVRLPPRSTRTDTLFPYSALFRSNAAGAHLAIASGRIDRPLSTEARHTLFAAERGASARKAWLAGGLTAKGRVEIDAGRSEEHTSELQSLMRISYAVFCLKKKRLKHFK